MSTEQAITRKKSQQNLSAKLIKEQGRLYQKSTAFCYAYRAVRYARNFAKLGGGGISFNASMFPSMLFVPVLTDSSYKIGKASRKSRMSLYLI